MAKTLVITHAEDEAKIPFLRGILTRSLQEAGLSFEDSYRVASAVRHRLREIDEIGSQDLRALVEEELAPYDKEVLRRYREGRGPPRSIVVQFPDGQTEPYSRGRQRLEMARCGLGPRRAATVTETIHLDLVQRKVREISLRDLLLVTYEHLLHDIGEDAAHRFLVWEEFRQGDRPLLLLIGGMAGTGKSTVAAALSHRFDIVRSQSTDMLREVMRMMMPKRLLPVLHTSSFLAWEALPGCERHEEVDDDLLIEGYLTQAELLGVAAEAVVHRAVQEHVSIVLEGVHVHPGLLPRLHVGEDAVVVQAMLGVLRPKQLRQRFRGRGKKTPGRRARRYLDHFDRIWRLQSYLLSEADRRQVPIVANDDLDRAVQELTDLVLAEIGRYVTGRPEAVFG
ncbi:MAG: hypothetical protein ACC662_00075 [Planctomycetota bacterium]